MAGSGSKKIATPRGSAIASSRDDKSEAVNFIPTGESVIDTQSVVGDLGRTYHGYKEGKYFLPNDAAEQDRLDFQYAALKLLMGGKLFFAPVTDPKHALDVATGTGIWAVELAEQFPACQITGTDLSSIQPGNAPPNVVFVKDDAEEDWLFLHQFDFVHLRLVTFCFNDPRKVMREAFKSMNSGAWLEYQDADISNIYLDGKKAESDRAFPRYTKTLIEGAKILVGRDVAVVPKYKEWMEEVGFINVQEQKLMLPANPWSEDPTERLVGTYIQRNYINGALQAPWKMLRAATASDEEAEQLIARTKEELLNTENRYHITLHIVYGQKP
ncbi:S-adenosyl-L-methionine-dependent methyltransferase [Xylariales sp. PMI_506]|nr:S-adenosyl-L-methionine-dependent methyltransferase [Xylariales sp. PMI_506]